MAASQNLLKLFAKTNLTQSGDPSGKLEYSEAMHNISNVSYWKYEYQLVYTVYNWLQSVSVFPFFNKSVLTMNQI
jgi:hypothetical protein